MRIVSLAQVAGAIADHEALGIGQEGLRPLDLPFGHRSCRWCGARELMWVPVEGGWRLHNGYSLHVCDEFFDSNPQNFKAIGKTVK